MKQVQSILGNAWIRACIAAFLAFLLPSKLAVPVLNALGHRIGRGARIGFSLVITSRLCMESQTRIGHGNLVLCCRLVMRNGSRMGRGNLIVGPMSIRLGERSIIGNRNKISRAPAGVSYGPACLRLGKVSSLTADHRIDCMCSILLGNYSTVAGCGSQMWTHGYYHYPQGPDRFRIDGKIVIGNNVYIGSMCVVSMGVNIADAITVGSHTSISKSLDKPGMYVSQALRYIETGVDTVMGRLEALPPTVSCDRVFRKSLNKPGH